MRKIFLLISSIVIIVVGFFLITSSAHAAQESLTVSPLKGEFKLTPGQKVSGSIKIKNSGEKPIDVEIHAELFDVTNSRYDQEFKQSRNQLAADNWIEFGKTNYHLEPKQQQAVNYHINTPLSVEPGGHYVAIIAQTKSDGEGVTEIRRIASLLYLQVDGAISKIGFIESMASDYWQTEGVIKANLVLQNTGNVHYRADGVVRLKDILGKEVGQTNINGLLMPRTSRLFEPELKRPRLPGIYRLESDINFPQADRAVKTTNILYLPLVYIYTFVIAVTVCGILFIRKSKIRKSN